MIRKLLVFTLTIALLGGTAFYFIRSKNKRILVPYKNFSEWYSANYTGNRISDTPPTVYTYVNESPSFTIDTIFRSMQGPLSIQTINLNEKNLRISRFLKGPELFWLIGYSVEIIYPLSGKETPDDFMCHSNLDIQNKKVLPWSIATEESFSRLFTLTEGQTKVMFPKGFGIPMLSTSNMVVYSQVLNHNFPEININVKHRYTIYYLKESELNYKMKPLFQQSCYVAKLVCGPLGDYDSPIDAFTKKDSVPVNQVAVSKKEDSCCTGKMNYSGYDPLHDQFGRTFTGHWKFNPGVEILKTDVTRMLNIKSDTKVHYIAVHVHPFCSSLELYDLTEGKTVFKAENENFTDKIGLKKIAHFESEEGLPIYKTHKYQLISTYTNTTEDIHTAMASMFLYLEEQK